MNNDSKHNASHQPGAGPKPPAGNTGAHQEDVVEVREKIMDQMKTRDDAADIALAAVDELADRAAEVESMRAELESTREQLLRKVAEFQNYRRRTDQEKTLLVEYGKSLVVQKLLDVLDDLERSLQAADKAAAAHADPAYQALRQGVDLTYRKFVDELKRLGVQPIEAVGKPFDEQEHEALMQRSAPDGTPAGIVLDELQRGYRMADRVLRHTKVVVSS